ncbi:DUF6099 family protein [Streptomyces montanisoli]|uniref:Uncharacterized protein n=1 Tax=Streptomyces montanisoli TaxID=2798581 RepID=A0A940M9Z5_9ACTN|nr:DUF6099 family protein [Streptomyces montanisoli]MBP0457082.1 hypothetical protein [Streptomyces montanisoli]
MDAVRIAEAGRDALALSGSTAEVVAEAWQAQALAQAVGLRLAAQAPPRERTAACELADAGERGCGPVGHAALRAAGGLRAEALTGPVDARAALTALGLLLEEAGMALVAVATAADDAWVYWQCVEAIDAAAESGDRVTALLGLVAGREREPEPCERHGPGPPRGGGV